MGRQEKTSGISRILHAVALAIMVAVISIGLSAPSVAFADITSGDVKIRGYRPDEVISTDVDITNGDVSNIGPMLAEKVIGIVTTALPILAVASVVVLIYNAIRNMFLPDEDPHEARKLGHKPKRPMGQVLKDIFMMYFWILFAWIIVELIIYAVTHLETLASDSLTSTSASQQTTTQQVASQTDAGQQMQVTGQPTPVGSGTPATPVGSGVPAEGTVPAA